MNNSSDATYKGQYRWKMILKKSGICLQNFLVYEYACVYICMCVCEYFHLFEHFHSFIRKTQRIVRTKAQCRPFCAFITTNRLQTQIPNQVNIRAPRKGLSPHMRMLFSTGGWVGLLLLISRVRIKNTRLRNQDLRNMLMNHDCETRSSLGLSILGLGSVCRCFKRISLGMLSQRFAVSSPDRVEADAVRCH